MCFAEVKKTLQTNIIYCNIRWINATFCIDAIKLNKSFNIRLFILCDIQVNNRSKLIRSAYNANLPEQFTWVFVQQETLECTDNHRNRRKITALSEFIYTSRAHKATTETKLFQLWENIIKRENNFDRSSFVVYFKLR